MRRGGGSRGGGGRGGGSFGGSRRSSRTFSTSRRHHRHHSRHRRGYYGPYGRRRYGYYGSRGNPLVGLVVFGVIFLLVASIGVSIAISTPNTHEFTLEPGATRAIDYSSFFDDAVEVSVTDGTIDTYFFDSEPPLSGSVQKTLEYQDQIGSADYIFYTLYLTEGSIISTSWSSSQDIYFYLIRGDNDFSSWEDGEGTELFDTYEDSYTHEFTADRSDNYYFAFENYGVGATVDITFDYNLKVHDVSNSNSQYSGSNTFSASEIDGSTIVLRNPNGSDDATVIVTVESGFSFIEVFLIIAITGGALIYFIAKRVRNGQKKKKKDSGIPGASSYIPQGTTQTSQTQQNTSQGTESGTSQYFQRPTPMYCHTCGTAILPDSSYCKECGAKL